MYMYVCMYCVRLVYMYVCIKAGRNRIGMIKGSNALDCQGPGNAISHESDREDGCSPAIAAVDPLCSAHRAAGCQGSRCSCPDPCPTRSV